MISFKKEDAGFKKINQIFRIYASLGLPDSSLGRGHTIKSLIAAARV